MKILTPIEKEIERIKKALIGYDPKYFGIALCDHEPDEIKYQQELKGESTSGWKYNPFYRCKKCMCHTDENGNPIETRM